MDVYFSYNAQKQIQSIFVRTIENIAFGLTLMVIFKSLVISKTLTFKFDLLLSV